MKTRFLIKLILFSSILLYALDALSQSFYLDVNWIGNRPEKININLGESYADSTSVIQELKNIRQSLIDLGYLTASVDTVNWAQDTTRAYIYAGRLYQWAELNPGNVPEEYLSKIGYREKVYRSEKFSPAGFSNLVEGLLKMGENNGYPFAELNLDSILIEDEGISA